MNSQVKQPDSEMIKRHVVKLREVCCQFDALNLLLDDAIAQAEADIRNSSLTAYRLGKMKRGGAREKELDSWSLHSQRNNGGGQTRTDTGLSPLDFESSASTNFATPPCKHLSGVVRLPVSPPALGCRFTSILYSLAL